MNLDNAMCDGKRCTKKQECTRFLEFEVAVRMQLERIRVVNPSLEERTGNRHCAGFERT